MKRRTKHDLVAAYLTRAAGLWAVYEARAAGANEIGVARNVGLRMKRFGAANPAVVFWCASKAEAMAVAAVARVAGKPAAEAIPEAAAALNVAVSPAVAVEARITATAKMLLDSADDMRRRGGMREINQSYKRLREARAMAGARPVSFNSYFYRATVMMFLSAMHAAGPEAQRRVAQLRERLMDGPDGRTP